MYGWCFLLKIGIKVDGVCWKQFVMEQNLYRKYFGLLKIFFLRLG